MPRPPPKGWRLVRMTVQSSADRALEPLNHVLLQDRVYETLRRAVMAGHFEPGERVTVRRLAERFNTSPMPVREALLRLVSLNAFETQPNRTVRIPEFSPEKLRALARARAEIEGTATAWAAQSITEPEIATLHELLSREQAAMARGDALALQEANQELHFAIYAAARCPPLIPCLEMLWLQVGPYLGCIEIDDFVAAELALHRDAIEALARHDPPAARAAIVANIERAAEHLLERWRQKSGTA